MRSILALCSCLLVPALAHADPPVQEGPTVVVHGRRRAPSVFTTVARARPRDAREDRRADLVREVPRTVQRPPF